ncbi:Rossmann-like domain-containing protein [Pantanalinema rosaneae CENA516]|uniref:Rossmann-like domain-containing protein n=1 Tax=Pantanalinema rosaneae TaxID=1620701 RepID=UPI003D6EB51A
MKIHPREIYDLLLESSCSDTAVQEIIIGLTWTFCRTEGIGLCMSPGQPTRTLPWSGTLVGMAIADLAPWLRSWDSYQAAIGMAVINSVINQISPLLSQAQPLSPQGSANLAVFEHFLPLIRGKRVVIIGRYPGLSQYEQAADLTILERQPTAQDLPDTACEYLLPDADWVFLTATSIANKTFPRLVELAQSAELVLMEPTVPWLPELVDMGIDYLAGVAVTDPTALRQTIAEGGGTRIFDQGVQYRILKLSE